MGLVMCVTALTATERVSSMARSFQLLKLICGSDIL